MKVFVDTNVMIDLLAVREPFFEDAARIFTLAHNKSIQAAVASISFATAAYILGKHHKRQDIAAKFRAFSSIVEIAAIDRATIEKSCSEDNLFDDIEDAMQHEAAIKTDCDIIVTRNPEDFKNSSIPVLSPSAFLKPYSSPQ